MSWSDICGVCGRHRADCECEWWDDVNGKYSKKFKEKSMSDGEYQVNEEYIAGLVGDVEKIVEKPSYNLKELVKDNVVHFQYYRQGNFYYNLVTPTGDYSFPVPLEDVSGATLNRLEKAITYMRWIRKAISDKTFIKI